MSENFCPHCMSPASGGRCPSCGGDTSWRGQKGIDLPVGTVLNGGNGLRTYQIGAARGKGGFGITYVARETNSGRRVAIKEYFPTRCAFRAGNEVSVQTMSGQEDVFRAGMNSFLDEGKMLLSQDDLTCVVHVIDYFQANGTAYLVMEYLDGVALHAQMTQMGGRIPVSELMPRLAPLMRDIGQLHRRGVIHRDISPDNIMWMPSGGLKLLDFGSARSMENGMSMTVLMKHGFSPIEQYRSKGQGPYTDIYALAATIYYCVTGVIPPAAVERLDEDGLQSPTALGAALTVDQETALLWALSVQPNARPQSMEEFAAMLYKETPPGPVPIDVRYDRQTGVQYNDQTGIQYNTQTGVQYNAQTGVQYSTQTGGQYNTQTGVQYNTQTGGQYNSQTGIQYNTQYGGQTGGNGQGQPGGGKNKTPIIIGGVAAAVVVLIAVLAIAWNGGGGDSTVEASYYVPPPSATPYVPSEVPTQIIGMTDDGYCYEIVDRSQLAFAVNRMAPESGYGSDYVAVLTGFEGTGSVWWLPDYVEGVPVAGIAANAFAGTPTYEYVYLPLDLEVIGAGAFRGCGDLQYVVAYSDVSTEATSFSGCDNLWFVYSHDGNVSGWNLPIGAHLFYSGMETDAGELEGFYDDVYDGVLIGETEYSSYVLLDVRPGIEEIDLDGVEWICSGALDNLSYGGMVNLGEETMYSYETFCNAHCSWHAPDAVLSDMWMVSCASAWAINNARSGSAPQVVPDVDLMYAARTRAEEYAELHELATRPDGSNWDTALSSIGYSKATGAAGYNFNDYQNMIESAEDYLVELYAPAISDSSSYSGQYYIRVGVGTAPQSNGQYAWWGFVTIP